MIKIKKPTTTKAVKVNSSPSVEKKELKKIVQNDQFAVFEYSNNQFKVTPKQKFLIPYEKELKTDEKILFEKVLMNNKEVGKPYIKNFVVVAKCLNSELKDKKIIVFKYKSKKNYRVKTGHRQKLTLLEVVEFKNDHVKKVKEAKKI